MVVITVKAYQNARVHTITIIVQDRLGIKNISDLLGKEICGTFGIKDLTEK